MDSEHKLYNGLRLFLQNDSQFQTNHNELASSVRFLSPSSTQNNLEEGQCLLHTQKYLNQQLGSQPD